MNKVLPCLILCMCMLLNTGAQETKPQFLKEPASWEFERFPLPPGFSPDFGYKGVEELRFAPGMFKKDSADYFSYAFVAQLDNVSGLKKSALKEYLFRYFSGLCSSTARNRKLTIDSSKISVSFLKKTGKGQGYTLYKSVLNIFGVFADGAPVKLNAEIKLLPDTKANKTYMVFITSPQDKLHAVWKELYAILNRFAIPE